MGFQWFNEDQIRLDEAIYRSNSMPTSRKQLMLTQDSGRYPKFVRYCLRVVVVGNPYVSRLDDGVALGYISR